MLTTTPAAEAGKGNCYPVFGKLRCDQLSASPASFVSKPQAAEPAIILAAVRLGSPQHVRGGAETDASEDPDHIICETRAVTGSRFRQQICLTRAQWKWRQSQGLSFERFRMLGPFSASATYY